MPRGSLRDYHAKRDFKLTAEPKGVIGKRKAKGLRYLIQKHDASRLHYDFRLEWNGTLLSWAVPKGPSENPDDKRLAVHVEDHPIEYGNFEGSIPEGQYGGGTVMLWDTGTWEPHEDDVDASLKKGKLGFTLHGKRLKGNWALVKLRARSPKDKDNWLLIKEHDEYERKTDKLTVERETTSVKSGRAMQEIAAGKAVWQSNRTDGRGSSRGSSDVEEIIAGPARTKRASGSKKKSLSLPSEKPPSKISSAKLPAFVAPQLATLVEAPPSGNDWLHEIKYDGYRAVTSVAGDKAAVWTRNALDWTDKFRPLVPSLLKLPCDSALLDGEIAVADADGRTDFGALQNALSEGTGRMAYYLFDLLHLDGEDLRKKPLIARKEMLRDLLASSVDKGPLIYSDHVVGNADEVFAQACHLKLEGLISKEANASYRSGRTRSWLKSKCGFEQEFVIIGWRPSTKAGRPFSSLLLAVREGEQFRYAGRVGSGYSGLRLENLSKQFKALARKSPPVKDVPPDIARRAKFIEPKLVAEIAFRGWTRDGLVRQGSFKGLRSDKPAKEIVKETPMPTPTRKTAKAAATSAGKTAAKSTTRGKTASKVSSARGKAAAPRKTVRSSATDGAEEIEGVRVTHPDKVLFAAQDVTKRELIDHYLSIADAMLPHIVDRPISLVRCPAGSGGSCFYQKHASDGFPDQFKAISIREKSGSDKYLYIEDERGLIAAVQVGVLELHLWGCHVGDVEKPDRMIFDFDPDEGLDFSHVKQAAKDMRDRLKDLGLESFPMVTGGKGVHVIVPLKPGHSWDQHREFAEALARVMAEEEPDRFVANMSKAKRRGKIFVDYLRNQRGATAICPFSTRARPGAYVAMPVSWQKLARLDNAHPVAVGEATRFLGRSDPWPDYFKLKQPLPRM
jgi:bifunctional non-homologous end joining protein LigD